MASKADELAKQLEEHGLDLTTLIRDTHAQSAMQAASLVGEILEIALKWKLTVEKTPVNDRMFKKDGPLATLQKRIDAAHRQKLINDTTREDTHILRRIRNEFAHAGEKLNFDSPKIMALASKLSTAKDAKSSQEAYLKAADNVSNQLVKLARALQGSLSG